MITEHLCGVQHIQDLSEGGAAVALALLTDQLDVSELAKVKVPLFLQTIDRQLQVHQLRADIISDSFNILHLYIDTTLFIYKYVNITFIFIIIYYIFIHF